MKYKPPEWHLFVGIDSYKYISSQLARSMWGKSNLNNFSGTEIQRVCSVLWLYDCRRGRRHHSLFFRPKDTSVLNREGSRVINNSWHGQIDFHQDFHQSPKQSRREKVVRVSLVPRLRLIRLKWGKFMVEDVQRTTFCLGVRKVAFPRYIVYASGNGTCWSCAADLDCRDT